MGYKNTRLKNHMKTEEISDKISAGDYRFSDHAVR